MNAAEKRMPRVAVVVATHAYCFPLEKCLSDFAAQTASPKDVILVDNGSGGSMTAWACEHAPAVTTLTRERNGFFCGGYNEGLRYAINQGYDFVLIVNADTEAVNSRLIAELLKAAERHPSAAFIGPKVFLREAGNVQNTVLTYPSFARSLVSFLQHKVIGAPAMASDDREREVEFLNGVCVLCRCAALQEIGLLDEAMGGYVEDTDWSWRAKHAGWGSVYAPIPSIIHHQPETGYEHYSLKSFMLRRNTIYWHWKRGARREARLYGWSARLLAWLRAGQAVILGKVDQEKYREFARRITEVDRGIRSGKPLGEWFGPPITGN
jgi:GT2 family glycosyltransferase